ncbi:MAG TPA: Nif3-like dinuclear metal center hexameric protein, partial [Fimbriimonadaceae bacterium]|nr:Nif3-like dinuclear metal center hexameric protein [Fimbriimonadaceae bacterium]
MPTVAEILEALQAVAPAELAFSFDKIGLQVGDPRSEVRRATVALDRSLLAIRSAIESGSQLLLTHHPIVWEPFTHLTPTSDAEIGIRELVRGDVSMVAAHTNWDCARGGVNDALAEKLGLSELSDFGSASEYEALKMVVFCPEDAVDRILDAASAAGAGVIGGYRRCGFAGQGHGTFDAPSNSNPAKGKPGARNRVPELRLEMELPLGRRAAVEATVRANHPYEEPAIDFLVVRKRGLPAGRKGRLAKPLRLAEFLSTV